MAAPTAQERLLISQFRETVKDLGLEAKRKNVDMFLLRWIRARDHDLKKAEEMLRRSAEWRKEQDIDNILSWRVPDDVVRMCPIFYCGSGFENCPVFMINVGDWDWKTVVNGGLKQAALRYFEGAFERGYQLMDGKFSADGRTPVSQSIFICDMEGFSMRSVMSSSVMDLIMQMNKSMEANQPESLKKIFVLNAGKVFQILFSLLKPILSEKTIGKLVVLKEGSNAAREALLQVIPENIIPVRFGGSNVSITDLSALTTSEQVRIS